MGEYVNRLSKALAESNSQTCGLGFVSGGYVAPLTRLVPIAGNASKSFDGGGYYADGQVCRRALHIKNGLVNIPIPLSKQTPVEFLRGDHIYG